MFINLNLNCNVKRMKINKKRPDSPTLFFKNVQNSKRLLFSFQALGSTRRLSGLPSTGTKAPAPQSGPLEYFSTTWSAGTSHSRRTSRFVPDSRSTSGRGCPSTARTSSEGSWESLAHFCRRPTAKGPSNYLSSSSSGHLVNLLLGCTSGLNLAADQGPVLVLFYLGVTWWLAT